MGEEGFLSGHDGRMAIGFIAGATVVRNSGTRGKCRPETLDRVWSNSGAK
jgi:hypothetical protein